MLSKLLCLIKQLYEIGPWRVVTKWDFNFCGFCGGLTHSCGILTQIPDHGDPKMGQAQTGPGSESTLTQNLLGVFNNKHRYYIAPAARLFPSGKKTSSDIGFVALQAVACSVTLHTFLRHFVEAIQCLRRDTWAHLKKKRK